MLSGMCLCRAVVFTHKLPPLIPHGLLALVFEWPHHSWAGWSRLRRWLEEQYNCITSIQGHNLLHPILIGEKTYSAQCNPVLGYSTWGEEGRIEKKIRPAPYVYASEPRALHPYMLRQQMCGGGFFEPFVFEGGRGGEGEGRESVACESLVSLFMFCVGCNLLW